MAVRMTQPLPDGSAKTTLAYGLVLFAGVMLCLASVFQILAGITAIANDTIYVRGVDYAYKLDVTSWGWIHLVLGVIALGAGIGIVMGMVWAFIAGIVLACLNAIANFAFLPHYPIWSLVVIGVNILVIWALCVQTSRRRAA